jgi:hypothetical protein
MKGLNNFNYINEMLSTLATRIENGSRLNDLSLNIHAEDFFRHLMNHLFEWQLRNINADKHNAEGIDLIDDENKIVAQVSSTATRKKVEDSLRKDLSAQGSYRFVFISISKDAESLRRAKKSFENPHGLQFSPGSDIHDVFTILKHFKTLDSSKQQGVCDFLREELSSTADLPRTASNLATIIRILAAEDWESSPSDLQTVPYDVEEKIEHNKLNSARISVGDYALYHPRVEKMYKELDQFGVNKRSSVLNAMRALYARGRRSLSADDLYYEIFEQTLQRIHNSSNYSPIPQEELEQCVHILVADAFIRCKIFENPEGYRHAAS